MILKVGDVVVLKSGSKAMTVLEDQVGGSSAKVVVGWFGNDEDNPRSTVFPVLALEKFKESSKD